MAKRHFRSAISFSLLSLAILFGIGLLSRSKSNSRQDRDVYYYVFRNTGASEELWKISPTLETTLINQNTRHFGFLYKGRVYRVFADPADSSSPKKRLTRRNKRSFGR